MLDKGALMKAQEIFTKVTKSLSPEALMKNSEPDANGNLDPNDLAQATEKFNLLIGKYGTVENKLGRSNMLATFLALSQIDAELRAAIKKVDLVKKDKLSLNQTLDQQLETIADNAIMSLSNHIIGGKITGKDSQAVLDQLMETLANAEAVDQSVLETKVQSYLDDGDNLISGMKAKGGAWLSNMVTPKDAAQQTSDIRKVMMGVAGGIEALVSKDPDVQNTAVQMISGISNNAPKWMPDFMPKLVDEIVGITPENIDMYSLMNPVKAAVSRIRQIYRTEMPKILAKQFTNKLTPVQQGQMHLMFGRGDIAALGATGKIKDITAMLTDASKMDTAIKDAEEAVRGLAQKNMVKPYMDRQPRR